MDLNKVLIATIAATTLMTGFSYIISEAYSKLFKEPVLLKKIMKRLGVELNEPAVKIAGWLLHYLIGLLFVIAYDLIWSHTVIKVSWLSGLVFGIISGIVGILGWMVIFRLPNRPPKVHFKEYYLQLFFAHIIFGLTATAVYKFY